MKPILVCFATKAYADSQARLVASAHDWGIETCLACSPRDIDVDFRRANRPVLSSSKGAGYWLWKPYFILRALRAASEGDVVIYVDAGARFVSSPVPLFELARVDLGIVLFQVHGKKNGEWTKMDCFHYMGCNVGTYSGHEQVHGAFQLYRKCGRAVAFVTEYLHFCRNLRIVSDMPNRCGQDNLREFSAHRHDQSVLSLLAVRDGLEIFRDPSQFGDRYKMVKWRAHSDYCGSPPEYAPNPYINSPYPTIFDHHRMHHVGHLARLRVSAARRVRAILRA